MSNTFKTTLGQAKHFFDTNEQDRKKLLNFKRARIRAAIKAVNKARLTFKSKPKTRTRTMNSMDASSQIQVENNDQTANDRAHSVDI